MPQLVAAAATIGRTPFSPPAPLRDEVFSLVWRACMVRANLVQRHRRYRRSAGYERLDPTEKGAVSFFIAQAQAKVFAEAIFGIAEFAHLDVVLDAIGQPRSKTRPDFVGYDATGVVALSVEAKGRTRDWSTKQRDSAKIQAAAMPSIVGIPTTAYAHLAYFDTDEEWRARLDDPPKKQKLAPLDRADVTLGHYLPLVEAVADARQRDRAAMEFDEGLVGAKFPEAGISVAVPEQIFIALAGVHRGADGRVTNIEAARERAMAARATIALPEHITAVDRGSKGELDTEPDQFVHFGRDGVVVRLDSSWQALLE